MLSLTFKALIAPITCCISIVDWSGCCVVGYGTGIVDGPVDEVLGYAVVGFIGTCGGAAAVRRFRVGASGTAGPGVEPGIVALARGDMGTADCTATLLQ